MGKSSKAPSTKLSKWMPRQLGETLEDTFNKCNKDQQEFLVDFTVQVGNSGLLSRWIGTFNWTRLGGDESSVMKHMSTKEMRKAQFHRTPTCTALCAQVLSAAHNGSEGMGIPRVSQPNIPWSKLEEPDWYRRLRNDRPLEPVLTRSDLRQYYEAGSPNLAWKDYRATQHRSHDEWSGYREEGLLPSLFESYGKEKQPETSTLERALSFQEWSDLHPDMVERELGYVVYRFVQGHDSLKTPSSARQLLENNQGLTSAQPNPSDDPSGYDAYGRPYQTDNGEGSSRSAQNTHHTTHHESGGPNVFGYEEK